MDVNFNLKIADQIADNVIEHLECDASKTMSRPEKVALVADIIRSMLREKIDKLLGEHPADDDEPITAEWLKTVGFTFDEILFGQEIYNRDLFNIRLPSLDFSLITGCEYCGDVSLKTVANRGDIRRLLAELGE